MLPLLTILLIVALLFIVGVWGLNRIGGRVITLVWLSCNIASWLFPVFVAAITGRGSETWDAVGALIHLPVLFSIIGWAMSFSIALIIRYRKYACMENG